MKKITFTLALVPGAASAHAGHPELAGAQGHVLAHFLIAGTALATIWGAMALCQHVLRQRREE